MSTFKLDLGVLKAKQGASSSSSQGSGLVCPIVACSAKHTDQCPIRGAGHTSPFAKGLDRLCVSVYIARKMLDGQLSWLDCCPNRI